jgi:hypothetical protein
VKALFLVAVWMLAACAPNPSASLPSPSEPARVAPTASPTATAAATVAAATATPAASQPTTPRSTAAPATTPLASARPTERCAPLSGGDQNANRVLSTVRAARQPGYDRVVFDFGPGALPPYVVEQVDRVIQGGSGFEKPVDGSFFINVRFIQAGGQGEYRGATQLRPDTEIVREVVLSTNFEGALEFGIGLSRLVCPRVSVLASPARLVLDFQ